MRAPWRPTFTAAYVGIAVPVIGAGAVVQVPDSRVTLLVFGIGVTFGILAAAPILSRQHVRS